MDKKTALINQFFMTFMMALSMSGLMSLVEMGPTAVWLGHWPKAFLIAWPIAFVMTSLVFPVAMAITRRIVRPALAEDVSNG